MEQLCPEERPSVGSRAVEPQPDAEAARHRPRGRGKKGGVIACAMAHRANRIAFTLVRDQAAYDPKRWAKGD